MNRIAFLFMLFYFFASEDIVKYQKWEGEDFFEVWVYSKECWIVFEKHFEKTSKFICFLVRIKRVNNKISKKTKHKINEKLKTKSEKRLNYVFINYRNI